MKRDEWLKALGYREDTIRTMTKYPSGNPDTRNVLLLVDALADDELANKTANASIRYGTDAVDDYLVSSDAIKRWRQAIIDKLRKP